MALNSLFPNNGSIGEVNLVESLIIESIKDFGQEFYYIPRKLVAVDDILGEDTLSKFEKSYQIEAYIDNVDGFGGNSAFMSKFGLYIEEQAQITIARKRWEELVGQYGATMIPSRPAEGDLLYFPKTDGLFEIKYVDHQNPFYQLGKLYVYKLRIELFQYSSERIETDMEEINKFALDMTFDVQNQVPEEANPAHRDSFRNDELQAAAGTPAAEKILNWDEHNPFGE